MPALQTMLVELNHRTTTKALLERKQVVARNRKAKVDLRQIVATDRLSRAFIGAWPRTMQAMLVAMMRDNLEREVPLPITWLWKPSYDYELTIWEAEDSAISHGGISVLLGSRYPLEDHPGDLGKRASQVSETTKVARAYRAKAKRSGARKTRSTATKKKR